MGFPGPAFPSAPPAQRRCVAVLAPLIQHRWVSAWITGAATVHLALAQAGLGGLGCPIRELTGVPCPGCGLTTAILDLFHGQWEAGLTRHAFAPVFLLGLAAIFLGAILPPASRLAFARWLARGEERTGAARWLALALLAYWIARLKLA